MSVVSEKSLSALKLGNSLEFVGGISDKASMNDKNEVFVVFVFKTREQNFKLQWEQNGRPKLPELKLEVMNFLIGELRNGKSVLTSGFDDAPGGGMYARSVIRFVDLLKRQGIVLSLK